MLKARRRLRPRACAQLGAGLGCGVFLVGIGVNVVAFVAACVCVCVCVFFFVEGMLIFSDAGFVISRFFLVVACASLQQLLGWWRQGLVLLSVLLRSYACVVC